MKCPICNEDMPEEVQRFLNCSSCQGMGYVIVYGDRYNEIKSSRKCEVCGPEHGQVVCLHCWVKYRTVGMNPIHKYIVELNVVHRWGNE